MLFGVLLCLRDGKQAGLGPRGPRPTALPLARWSGATHFFSLDIRFLCRRELAWTLQRSFRFGSRAGSLSKHHCPVWRRFQHLVLSVCFVNHLSPRGRQGVCVHSRSTSTPEGAVAVAETCPPPQGGSRLIYSQHSSRVSLKGPADLTHVPAEGGDGSGREQGPPTRLYSTSRRSAAVNQLHLVTSCS
ncbi:hypothetical protein HJG60_008812 [Phyllostomus discolor]|uniref:Uncharacterized protein n=1 Tax=Phyllostomus discolor TaxID=89673 RepID=A0A833YWA9_9CHIR|nr:hypothetical protein HJG60_008812 [Phyllostomus discolor]